MKAMPLQEITRSAALVRPGCLMPQALSMEGTVVAVAADRGHRFSKPPRGPCFGPKRQVLSSVRTVPPFKGGVLGVVSVGGAVAAGDCARVRRLTPLLAPCRLCRTLQEAFAFARLAPTFATFAPALGSITGLRQRGNLRRSDYRSRSLLD
ncbi:hypothetical protein ACVWWO_005364 [Bradyrhizobium sp. F1.13.1]